MTIEFDFTEVLAFDATLGDLPRELHENVRKAIEISARGVKDDWRNVARGLSGLHARGYPFAISYDIEKVGDGVLAEVGPEQEGQGKFGFLEEGVASQGTSPQHAARLAVKANTDDFIRGILKAATDPLER